jgi:hypothetical protein
MVAINYPSMPRGVDVGAIMDQTQAGFDDGKAWRDNKNAESAFGKYLESLYSGQGGQPQQAAAAGPQFGAGQVQRAPLGTPDAATARVDQAFAAPGQTSANSLSGNQIAGRFLKTVRDGGLTNPYGLAAVASTGKHESGFDPKNVVGTWSDPSQSGAAGTAGGIMSWRGDRLAKLQAFAQQNGDNPQAPSPETQGKYLLAEDPSLIARLQAAQSPAEAQQIMNQAWKFAGYDQPGGEAGQRIADAQAYAPQFGGGAAPSQQALEGLAVGGSVPMGQPGPQTAQDAPQGAPQQQMQPQQAASILPPREVMAALFKSPDTRPLAIQLVKAAQGLSIDQNDPQKQLEYQIAVEKLKALRDPQSKLINAGGGAIYDPNTKSWVSAPEGTGPGKGKFGNTVVWGQDAEGKWVAMQPNSAGGLELAPTPDGVTLSPPGASNLNLGTSFGVRDRNGQIVNQVPIDNAGKASDTAYGKGQGEARSTLASMQSQLPGLQTVVGELDKIAERATYTTAGQVLDVGRKELGMSPRDAAVARTEYISKVSNQILPMLRDTFGAQFTAREGDTLMATMGDPDKTPAEKQAVLKSFIEQKARNIQALAQQTGQPAPDVAAPPAAGRPQATNPQTGETVEWDGTAWVPVQ